MLYYIKYYFTKVFNLAREMSIILKYVDEQKFQTNL